MWYNSLKIVWISRNNSYTSFYFFVEYDTEQVATVFDSSAIESDHSTSEYRKITNENPSCANHESSRQVFNDGESAVHIRFVQAIHAAESTESDH